VVDLVVDDATAASVPAQVTISAGQTSSDPVALNAVDDDIADGTQTATVSAQAPGHTDGSDTVDLTDDEVPALTLTIAAPSFSENGGMSIATIFRNTDTTNPLTVTLANNDPSEASLPSTITIAAAADTSDPFTITGVDDSLADGPEIITITASTGGHADGTDTVDVTDDESPTLTFLSIARQTPPASPTDADTLVFRATFSEAAQNVDAADFAVTGTTAAITGVTPISEAVFDLTVSGGDLASLIGTVGLNLLASQNIADSDGKHLPSGEPATDQAYTLENAGPGVLSGSVFTDTNGNGIRDGGEPGRGGVTVIATETATGTATAFVTIGDGSFAAVGPLPGGAYTLTVTPPAGQVVTTDHPRNITLSGATSGIAFGVVTPFEQPINLGGAGIDEVTVRCVAGYWEVVDKDGNILRRTRESAVHTLTIDGTTGADTYTVDFSGGCFPVNGIVVNGQAPARDTLHIIGAPGGDHEYTYNNANDGHIDFSIFGRLTFFGLTPLTNDGTAANVIFNIPVASNVELINHMNLGQNTIQSSPATFETTTFNNPTNSLIINGSSGNDTFLVTSLDAGFAATFTINGGSGDDTLLGNSTSNEFQLTGTDAGQLLSDGNTYAFTSIQALTGTAADDTFALLGGSGRLTGSVSGGLGTDTLSYSGFGAGAQILVDGTAGDGQFGREVASNTLNGGNANGFTGIENLIGAGVGVPTLTEWGIILLTLLMAMTAYTRLRERMA
jgi:hypothetical protein